MPPSTAGAASGAESRRRGGGLFALRFAIVATLLHVSDDDRDRLRKLIVTGDNRLKQGGSRQAAKARESFAAALAHAEQTGLADERIRGLLERRLTDALAIETAGDA